MTSNSPKEIDQKSLYSIEVYEKLAKLFAGENVGFVINPDLPTAAFDIKNRTIYLPFWEFDFKPLYHFVIAHEIGHALYTPDDEVWKDPELKSILNIVEDYRIDIKMKTKYPGLVSDYNKGVNWLVEHDFFGTAEKIQSKLQNITYKTFLDRLVLYLKIKANDKKAIDISFTTEEKRLINKSILASSFDDVVAVSREILEYLKLEKEKDQTPEESKNFEQTTLPESNTNQSNSTPSDGETENDSQQQTTQPQQSESEINSDEEFGSEIQNNLDKKISESQSKNKKIDVIKDAPCDIVKIDRIYTKRLLKDFSSQPEDLWSY